MTNNNSNSFYYSDEDVSQIDKDKPSIYVTCLASYNSGKLHGCWIDATQDENAIFQEIGAMLDKSPAPDAEEWIIDVYHGFGSLEICEHSSIKSVCEQAQFISSYGALGEAAIDYYDDIESAKDALTDYYHGDWDSEINFATMLFDDIYAHEIPESIRFYIDYEAFRRDLFIDDYFSLNVEGKSHVFSYH